VSYILQNVERALEILVDMPRSFGRMAEMATVGLVNWTLMALVGVVSVSPSVARPTSGAAAYRAVYRTVISGDQRRTRLP
jgi:hypothetical protein